MLKKCDFIHETISWMFKYMKDGVPAQPILEHGRIPNYAIIIKYGKCIQHYINAVKYVHEYS